MLKTIRSISRTRRAPILALATVATLTALSVAPADGAPVAGGSKVVASGFHYNYDFNSDGRQDDRLFWFYAIEHADGSVTGQASLRIVIDDPAGEPFTEFVRIQITDAVRYSADEAVVGGIVTATNDPFGCLGGVFSYAPGTQVGFSVRDNGPGNPDQITPLGVLDCVPFVGSDYGVDDSVGFAHWFVDTGFYEILLQPALTDIDFGRFDVR